MKWKAVVGWEGTYEVSDMGLVRSLDRVAIARHPHGKMIPRRFKGKILTNRASLSTGYSMVSLTSPGREREQYSIHQVVLIAFVGPCPPTLEACHFDGDKCNNKLTNLRWDTRKGNRADGKRLNEYNPLKGEAAPSSKLDEKKVRFIRANATKLGQREMGRMFGVRHNTIGHVISGKSWKDVK